MFIKSCDVVRGVGRGWPVTVESLRRSILTTLPAPTYLTNSSAQREHNRRTDINTAVSSISVSRITKHSENLRILYAFWDLQSITPTGVYFNQSLPRTTPIKPSINHVWSWAKEDDGTRFCHQRLSTVDSVPAVLFEKNDGPNSFRVFDVFDVDGDRRLLLLC